MPELQHLASMENISDGNWGLCNTNFDRDAPDATTMLREGRGNCFTLTEYLCNKLRAVDSISTVGVCLEVLPNRRNYHACAWALFLGTSGVVRFDLLDDRPTEMLVADPFRGQLAQLKTSSIDALYYSTSPDGSCRKADRRQVNDPYQWPDVFAAKQTVFLAADAGVAALHAIAAEGGTHHLLPAIDRAGVPTLPLAG